MPRPCVRVLVLALILAAPMAAHAERPARPTSPAAPAGERAGRAGGAEADAAAAGDCARARRAGRVCSLDFEGDRVGGSRPGGFGDYIGGRGRVTYSSLIRLRTSFRAEIVRAADRL